jgi:GNAT superfamily N-acetyltransferase
MMRLIWHHNTWPWGKTVRIVTSDGSAIVEMSFEDINPGVCYLSGLSVIPPKRRKGIAKLLMFACESYCRENGIFRIDLNSVLTDWVQEFYKKCGYAPIKEENGFMQMYKIIK